ncbi:MAG: formate--tetrahydrofolate ligase [Acidobacteriota bacterium]|nr:formate--tetrahydrofolate ligase [Acidobacteriota bacterium]
MQTDLEIARRAKLRNVVDLAREKFRIPVDHLEPYGHYKAKLSPNTQDSGPRDRGKGKLILVTAISPTPAGEGKTTTVVGLGDALNRLGKKALICLREPSLGPCFGMKGGAAGGGMAQVVPMEDINLHFTGDFHALGLAHNLLAAMLDNHIHQGNRLEVDLRRVTWNRVVDLNDRALRRIVLGLGGAGNSYPREGGFEIVAASEVMAILCLSRSLQELKQRLGNITVGYDHARKPIRAADLEAHGAMAVLLKEALKPNLVQTLENNPALVHGGPFANIAHGCNSVIATRTGLGLADYLVTEAGFGADLGAEKFVDIKCRKAGLRPDLVVLVATLRALKYHGGADKTALEREDLESLERGIPNLERHLNNIRNHYGLPCVVAINRFSHDTPAEIALLKNRIDHHSVPVVACDHWARGSQGTLDLAETVVETIATTRANFKFVYDEQDSLWEKITKVATRIYGASEVVADTRIRARIRRYQKEGFGHYPVCIAKTQYSFSTDPLLRGAPSGHVLPVKDVRLATGAEFLVVICGDILTMPGLPRQPAANRIDLDEDGRVVGLF